MEGEWAQVEEQSPCKLVYPEDRDVGLRGAERLIVDCGISENLDTPVELPDVNFFNKTYFFPRRSRKPVIVFCGFLTS